MKRPDRDIRTDAAAEARDQVRDDADRVSDRRDDSGAERDLAGDERDSDGDRRDVAGGERDAAAARRDVRAERFERRRLTAPVASVRAALARRSAASDRKRAADDRRAGGIARVAASRDRSRAHDDRVAGHVERVQAELDREASAVGREIASFDGLTRAYVRDAGLVELRRDVARARRTTHSLVVAFVDVDGLKRVNDVQGHAVGDQLLADVAETLRTKLRPYDLVIRYGGDEFVCALAGLSVESASARFHQVSEALAATPHGGSVTVGLADLGPADTIEDVIARADAALYAQRRAVRGPRPATPTAPA